MTAAMTYRATTALHEGNPIWRGTLQLHGNVTSFQTEAIAVPTTSAPRPDWGSVLHLHARQCTPIAQHQRQIYATRFCFRLIAVDERGFPREEPRLDAIAAVMEEGELLFRVRVQRGWILVWGMHDERGNSSLLGGFYEDGTP
eukprot:TRINITY_DN2765_c0_g2_i1.p2 TRINITY_DN2765_c0_g2~~TRINITY_DN2765_c0_g2_i1.p2  ORF type:complete len:143 (+),score=25.70 TRINITY_DN2765_c0_g2_i1:791-1219(+)